MMRRTLPLLLTLALAVHAGAQAHPNNARGFDPEKAFQTGDVDHVNLFSGNLIVTLPIGQAFPVSERMSYQLQLVYNGNPWDYRTDGAYSEGYPSRFLNAGIGWQLTLGNLVSPNDPDAVKLTKQGNWVYAAPDGAERMFFTALHHEEIGTAYEASETPGDDQPAGYTRDSSYLRLVRLGAELIGEVPDPEPEPQPEDAPAQGIYVAKYAIEFPDGTVHTFASERYQAPIASPSNPTYERSAKYSLVKIEDRHGKSVTISDFEDPAGTARRTITDSVGREHTIDYVKNDVYRFRGSLVQKGLVTSVRLAAASGETVEYVFTYGDLEEISTPCAGTAPTFTPTTVARFLKSVSVRKAAATGAPTNPTLLTYSMENYTIQTGESCSFMAGHLTKLTLPTGGSIEYEPGSRRFPSEKDGWPGSTVPAVNFSAAVGTRTVVGTDGTRAAWTYQGFQRNPGQWWNEERQQWQSINRELAVVVTDPLDRSTANYFNVYKGLTDSLTCFPGADVREYGLPYTRTKDTGTGTLHLSTEVFPSKCFSFVQNQNAGGCPLQTSCRNASGTVVQPVRRTYVRYEFDTGGVEHPQTRNQRMAVSRTTFLDDTGCTGGAACYTQTASSDFDGLGHYRSHSQTSNIAGTTDRTTTTEYDANPAAGTYTTGADPATYMLAFSDPWLLNLYSEVTASQGSSTEKQSICFDRTIGVITRTRAHSGSTPDDNDLLTAYTYTEGNVTSEVKYGGDAPGLTAMADACVDNPGTAAYTINHGYTSGTRTSSAYATTTFKSLDLDVDADTALPTASRDMAGVETSLAYDVLGRVTEAQPEGEARTEYVYDLESTPASVTAKTIDGTTTLAEKRYFYDGHGRLIQTRVHMPDSWAVTQTTYDLLGRPVSRSTALEKTSGDYAAITPDYATTFEYDRFGRVTKVTAPDGSVATTAYTGARLVDRTVTIGASSVTTRESYDGHGRLIKVTEDVDGSAVPTSYEYDVADRLTSVSTTADGVTQTRTFTYDGRGLLVSEQHPEKGAAGDGLVTYPAYDAAGRVLRRIEGTTGGQYDLEFTYDVAERLTSVRDLVPGTSTRRSLKEFTYATENALPGDARKGKLLSAKRFNYLPDLGLVTVEETYKYSGLGGRPAVRDTVVTGNASFSGASFTVSQAWNALGQPASVTYPSTTAVNAPSRTVTYGYTAGFLTEVGGYVSSISYQPSGLVETITHANGVTEEWEGDSGMPRPLAITVTPAGQSGKTYGDFTYDGAGNITAIGTASYEYDASNRLTAWTETEGQAYSRTTRTYDAFGNYLDGTYLNCTAPGAALFGCATSSFKPFSVVGSTNHYSGDIHDDAGNIITAGSQSYGYDAAGMMNALVSAGRDDRYIYTADDERIAVADRVAGKTTWTVRGTTNQLLRTFTRTTLTGTTGWSWTEDEIWRGGLILASESPSGRKQYHLDHLGSPRWVTNSAGALIGEQRFTPFGTGGSSDGGRIQFTGHEADHAGNEQGLIYAHARFLEPERGRFLSVDPTWESADLGKPQSWNRYSYVMNNPVNLTDPDGKCPICIDVVVDLLTDGSGLDPEPRPDLTKPLFGGTVTRYMGAGEAEYARRTGYIPNTNAKGVERPTHVTTDEPVDKAKTAKKKYELPVTPTHRATVPEDRVPGGLQPTPDGRPRTSGGGSQSAATRPIPVKESEIVPLKQSAWKTLLKWLF